MDLIIGASTSDEIFLAPFNCKNFIAFFHEFAHIKLSDEVPFNVKGYCVNNTSKMQYEFWISMLGINYAIEQYNIVFSDDAVSWLIRQNLTYKDSKAGELSKLINSSNNSYSIKYMWIN